MLSLHTLVYTEVMPKPSAYERVIFSLPRPLVTEMKKYASVCRAGNKSGFVADAVRAYITSLRRHRHTEKLRDSYAQSAQDSLAISQDLTHLDEESWDKLDKLTTTDN